MKSRSLKLFLAELKRRNVYKVAVAYAVVGWLAIQAASIVLPAFHAPEWLLQTIITLVIIGFPIAVVIAWAFELTPEGIKRTEEADVSGSEGPRTQAWIYIAVIGALFSVGLFFLGRYTAANSKTPRSASEELSRDKHDTGAARTEVTTALAKSIAVLPFESLSEDKSNAYFATGIQDEILARLAKIADLKVISRTSTLQYQSKPANLSEIARQLGVAHVLEGSVQKSGDQVRVNVQLINAANDTHVWAEIYDRKLTDIFAVESEIAKSVTQSLQATLTGREEQALAIKPTNNQEAYNAYLRGLAAEAKNMNSVYAMEEAVRSYEQAVKLDPTFALAWSKLSRANSMVYASPNDPTESRRDAAKHALDMAQKLQPDSPETQLALAYYQTVALHDYELAQNTFRLVGKMLPGNTDVPTSLAYIARRQGRWDEAVAYYEQGLLLDPRNPELLADAAGTYSDLRKYDAALKLCDRALDIRPNDLDLMAFKAGIYQCEGKLENAAELLREANAEIPSLFVFGTKITQLRLEHDLTEAVRMLQARVDHYHFGADLERGAFTRDLAFHQHLIGDNARAKITAEEARKTLELVCKNQPNNVFAATCLSQAYAILGDKNSAVKEAERAITLKTSVEHRTNNLGLNENLAIVQTIIGDNSSAISMLTRLLNTVYWDWGDLYGTSITPALLRLDPAWDSLRTDPAFRKLYEGK